MKKIFAFVLIFAFLLSSCVKEEPEIIEENEIIEESFSSESEVQVEIKDETESEEIPETCGEFYCVTNSDLHEENLSFSMQLPEGWKISGSSTVDFNGSKVAECYMKCGESYEDWLNEKTEEYSRKEIGGKIFYVFSYENSMLNYDNENGDFKEMNKYEISEYEFHSGRHGYRFALFENKDKDEEYTEEFEKALETFVPAESYIKIENGKLSGMIHPMVPISPEREDVFENELVSVSMSLPEGWEVEPLEEKGEICGITFKLPWDNYHYASFYVYKDTGTTYEDFLANHSLWVGIDEHTYHEVSGDFLKGSYIHFDYPASEKYDVEEDAVSVYLRMYQLQFDGYVADVAVYIRIDSEENTAFDDKICDEYVSSIKLG